MKVIKWISYNDTSDYKEAPCGGLCGWFDNWHRWEDYIETYKEESHQYLNAIKESVIKKRIRYTGAEHQNAEDGCPVFEDGTSCTFSYRAWGDLMAAIWSSDENKDYHYMDFYM